MRIDKVSYGRTFSLGSFQSERIDLEASIDESDDIELIFAQLKKQANDIHVFNNPHLYQEQDTIQQTPEWATHKSNATYSLGTQEIPEMNTQPIDNQLTQEQKIHNLISQATSIPELKQYHLLSQNKKYPELKEAYEKKLLELSK
jgi:hypothetical protein